MFNPSEYHPNRRKSRAISSFLKKTYEILQVLNDSTKNSENMHAIKWSQSGVGFIVVKEELFSKQILPRYFKHSNYSSFVRQLNMYNFHKIREANNESHFHHEYFRKNDKQLLAEIKRKPEKKKRKNQEGSEQEQEYHPDQQLQNSEISMKDRIKPRTISNENISKSGESQIKIKSYKSTMDKKGHENTCHLFGSQKQNQGSRKRDFQQSQPQEQNQSKERVSIQNILSVSIENDEDKLSINNELAQGFPRYPTKEIFYPSNNNIYPFPINFKGNVISHFSIFY